MTQHVSEYYLFEGGNHPIHEPDFISPQETGRTWSQVANQSERQLGAFLYLHLFTTGTAYELDKKGIELRNKVVHRGYLPTLQEATQFGERTWNSIMATLGHMSDHRMLNSPTEGDQRALRRAKEMPHVNLLKLPHVLMLHPDSDLGGFSERLFLLRTTWRRAVYGRGPKSDS